MHLERRSGMRATRMQILYIRTLFGLALGEKDQKDWFFPSLCIFKASSGPIPVFRTRATYLPYHFELLLPHPTAQT